MVQRLMLMKTSFSAYTFEGKSVELCSKMNLEELKVPHISLWKSARQNCVPSFGIKKLRSGFTKHTQRKVSADNESCQLIVWPLEVFNSVKCFEMFSDVRAENF